MGFFRFRRSIKILPGVRLNLGKTGVSTSIGVRGAHVTIGHGKVRRTVGIPGTGLSYTDVSNSPTESSQQAEAASPGSSVSGWWAVVIIALLAVIGYRLISRTG